MKRSMAILLAAALLTLLLCGCGELKPSRPAVSATPIPETTLLPESMMPDPEDGEVNDRDGIIEPGDNGGDDTSDTGTGAASGKTGVGNTGKPSAGGTKLR